MTDEVFINHLKTLLPKKDNNKVSYEEIITSKLPKDLSKVNTFMKNYSEKLFFKTNL